MEYKIEAWCKNLRYENEIAYTEDAQEIGTMISLILKDRESDRLPITEFRVTMK